MNRLRPIFGIAELTVRAGLRSRLWMACMAVALTALVAGWLGATASVWSRGRFLVDASLCAASLLGQVLAVALAAEALAGDAHGQGEWMLLCRPVGRKGLLVGRLLGIAALLWMQTAALAACCLGALAAAGWPAPVGAAWAFATTAAELCMTLSLAALFLALSSRPLAITLTAVTWLCGQGVGELEALADNAHLRAWAPLVRAATHALPDFGRVSLRDVVGQSGCTATVAAHAMMYGMGYAVWVALLAALSYERRSARLR